MPFPVQIRRFSNLLQRVLGLQGNVALTLLDDVSPVLDIHESAPEWRYSRGEWRFAALLTGTAVAGQFTAVGVITGSRERLTVVERLVVRNPTAGPLVFTLATVQPPTSSLQRGVPLDARLRTPVLFLSDAQMLEGAQAGFPAAGERHITMVVPANDSRDLLAGKDEPVLVADAAAMVFCGTVNTSFVVSAVWREHQMAPQEPTSG